MNHGTWKQFQKLIAQMEAMNLRLDALDAKIAALVQQGDDRAAAKALAADVSEKTGALQQAVNSIQPKEQKNVS